MNDLVIWSLIVVLGAIASGLFWLNNYAKRAEPEGWVEVIQHDGQCERIAAGPNGICRCKARA